MVKLDPSHTKKVGDPTNKTIVFTMVVHSYVLLQSANLFYLKTKDEASLSWRKKIVGHPQFVAAISWIVIAQIFMLESTIKTLRLCSLTYFQHFFCVLIAVGSLVWLKLRDRLIEYIKQRK